MKLKTLMLPVLITALCNNVLAQDKLYKRNGDIIEAKIKSVGVKTITYLRFDNQSGPEYTIVKNEVEKIVYQNGSEDVLTPSRESRASRHQSHDSDFDAASKIKYKPDVLSIAPLQFTENGLGFGLSYERALDKKGYITFYLPVSVTFNLNNGTYYDSASGASKNGPVDPMIYAMPGIKVYPTGCNGYIRYAIGPSVVIGSGQKSTAYSDYYTGQTTGYTTQNHFVLGMILNNSMNINPSPHIYLGIELGMGFTYLNQIGGLNQGTEFLVQGGIKIGYRF